VLPLVGLVVVALSPFWNGTVDVASMSLDNFRELFDFPGATDAMWTSVTLSLTGVLIAVPRRRYADPASR